MQVVTALAATVDRVAMAPLTGRDRARKRRVDAVRPARRIAILEEVAEAYAPAAPWHDVDRFFPVSSIAVDERPAPRPWRWLDLARRGIRVTDLRWPSELDPFLDVPALVQRFRGAPHNRAAAARLFRHRAGSRRTVVLVHGYRAGRYAVEEHLWPVRWFLKRGLDVALFTLPFHGVRRGRERFFTPDPRVTNETLRQAIVDLRGLVKWLRRRGSEDVGVLGMSLGGYTVSLLATVEPVDLLCPFIPLGAFADSARDGGWLNGDASEQRAQYEAMERAYRCIDPFTRAPKVAPERSLVIAGRGDRITPARQGARLAEHFGARFVPFAGGHLLQAGRGRGFRALSSKLHGLGWLQGDR